MRPLCVLRVELGRAGRHGCRARVVDVAVDGKPEQSAAFPVVDDDSYDAVGCDPGQLVGIALMFAGFTLPARAKPARPNPVVVRAAAR